MKAWQIILLVVVLAIISASFYLLPGFYGALVAGALLFACVIVPVVFKNPVNGLVMIAFCLPFERVPTLAVGGMTLKINHLLIVLTLVALILSWAIKGGGRLPRDPIRFLIALFIAIYALSVTQAPQFSRAVQVIIFMALMFVVYFITTVIIDDRQKLILVLKGLFWGAVVSGLIGLFQFAGDAVGLPIQITLLKEGYDKSTFGFARIQSTAAEPLYFANYIFIPLILTTFLLIRDKFEVIAKKSWGILALAVLLIDFVLAVSRGAYLAAALVLVLFAITQYKRVFTLKFMLPTFLLIGFIVVGVYLALVKNEPRAIDEFIGHVMVNDYTVGESVVSRLTATEEAMQLFSSHKILGIGPGNFGPVSVDSNQMPSDGWPIVNNEYVELLAESGVVGFMSFLLLVAFIIMRAIKAYFREKDEFMRSTLLAFIFAFIAILVQYYTFSTLPIIHIWFLIALIGTVVNLIYKNAKQAS